MTKKIGRVPNVLWKQFRDKAATLSNTIIKIIPNSCNCNSKGKCIRCIFGNSEEAAMSYLIRPNDPSDYIDMMTNSWFVVVPPDAPTLSPLLTFTRHWSQLQIVERSIQTFFSKDISPSNVICQGYQKFKLHSTTVKVLTNWTWELALKRVGDSVMLYLLMHTLVFMPIRGNAHQQVVGPHVNRLFAKFPMHIPLDDVGSSMHARKRQKRRRGNGEVSKPEEPASKVPCITNQQNVLGSVSSKNDDYLGTHFPKESALISEDCLHGHHVPEEKPIEKLKVRPGKRLRLPSWQRRKRNKRLRLQDCCTEELSKKVLGSKVPFNTSQQNVLGSVSSKNDDYVGTHCPKESTLVSEDCSYGHHFPEEQPTEKLKVRPGKRLRLPSWQRRKRYKRLRFQDCCTQELSKKVLNDEDDLRKTCPHGLVKTNDQLLVVPTSDKIIHNLDGAGLKSEKPLCLCCSVFQSLSKIPKDAEINRKLTFYNLKSSSSLFLKMHVLYSLKCGFTGINDLLKHIFGLNMSTQNLPASCFHKQGLCSHASSCLYHSFVKLLKVFRRRTKICRHINLLEKHCSSQPLFQFGGDKDVSSSLQASMMESDLSRSKQDVNQVIDQMPKRRTLSKRDRKQRREVVQCQFGISRPYCLKDEVVSFIWAVCRNIIPPDLLGLPANRRSLRRNISRFIRLRRFEKFSLKQCMHKLEASKFPLLSNMESCKSCNSFSFAKIPGLLPESQNTARCDLKQMLLERWIFWVFTYIVVPLVQANFYVTESEHGRQNLYYYRKTAWKKLSDRVATLLKKQSYRSLDNASLASILRKRSFGFSKVRLCPKESGARPIANLKAPSRFFFKRSLSCAEFRKKKRKVRAHRRNASFFKSVNTVLRDLHVILKDLKVKEPERWGSTVFSYGDIHRKLCSFLRQLKEGKPTMPMVFFVVADVQKAFDTVNQDKLLSILSEIQIANKYSFQKSCEIFCRKKSLWIFENRKLMSEGNNSESTKDIPPVRQKTCQTVVVNQKQTITVRRKELKFNLEEHLKNNVLKLGRRFYLQTVGIPQGSVLSTLLCTLYYGHMERNKVFPYLSLCGRDIHANNGCAALEATPDVPFSSPEYLLLRFVDDFLFVSTSKKQASSFFSRLRRGFREYNCYMNQDKFCMNFDPDSTHKPDSKRLLVGSNGVSFMKWSGLLINCRTFEVQADYTRYHNDHLSSTLTVSWQHRPGRQLKAKLRAYVRPKCHPMFYDSCLNSPAIIRLNVYQAFVVCAMKFHCYVRELSFWCKVTSGSCLYSIEGSIRYMYKLMRRKMYRVVCTPDCHKPHRVLKVAKKEVTWLGLKAYIRVLSKKKSRHFELLRLLRTKLATLSNIGGSSALKYAVDDCHSSIMWEIKY